MDELVSFVHCKKLWTHISICVSICEMELYICHNYESVNPDCLQCGAMIFLKLHYVCCVMLLELLFYRLLVESEQELLHACLIRLEDMILLSMLMLNTNQITK